MNEISLDAKRHAWRMYTRVKRVAELIVEEYGVTEQEAISNFYHSQLYRLLTDESTKVWWFSTPALFELYKRERLTGMLDGAPYLDGLTG
jgi:hypothetical protein